LLPVEHLPSAVARLRDQLSYSIVLVGMY
jgi:hypothetical protein